MKYIVNRGILEEVEKSQYCPDGLWVNFSNPDPIAEYDRAEAAVKDAEDRAAARH